MVSNSHRFTLEPYRGRRTRYPCPVCEKPNEFTRYIDTRSGGHLAKHVGKCNRLNKCGYHYTPSDYFNDNPQLNNKDNWKDYEAHETIYLPSIPPIDYIPSQFVDQSCKQFAKNNFFRFLLKLFGEDKALRLAARYKLGTSRHWKNADGYSVIFWQIDAKGQPRQAKVMAYNPDTGKRLKTSDGLEVWRNGRYHAEVRKPGAYFAGKRLLKNYNANLVQCFFGEHLLDSRPLVPVAIVESEKTAVVMAGIMPEPIWIATGGANGAKWTERRVFEILKGRKVILYPDLGMTAAWKEKAKILNTVCRAFVSNLLEEKAHENDRIEGYDIADYFIKSMHPSWIESNQLIHPVAEWGYEPSSRHEVLAIMAKENPIVLDLIERFNLEVVGNYTSKNILN